jgi:hypothetical protein
VHRRANEAYEAYRARGVMKDGRRFGKPPPLPAAGDTAGQGQPHRPRFPQRQDPARLHAGYNTQGVCNEHHIRDHERSPHARDSEKLPAPAGAGSRSGRRETRRSHACPAWPPARSKDAGVVEKKHCRCVRRIERRAGKAVPEVSTPPIDGGVATTARIEAASPGHVTGRVLRDTRTRRRRCPAAGGWRPAEGSASRPRLET